MLHKLSAICWLLILIFGINHKVSAQTSNIISGVVTADEDGETLPGVTITVEGTTRGTISDIDGNYSLKAEKGEILNFSFIGFSSTQLKVGTQSIINVTLETNIQALSEVVVVGYGSVRKSDLTGSVSSVGSEELTAFPALSAVQTLQGRASGVQIQSNNGGQPGADFSIRIRGGTSINASSDPLRVVDGFVGAEMPPPEDIASVEILKDASATAIYGSRGANGVIMITTKRGKSGKMKIDVNSSYSAQTVLNRLELLNGEQFANYIQEVNENYTGFGANTDWQDQIYRTGYITNNQVSISGGSDKTRYYISGTAFNQQGAVEGSSYERYSISGNFDIKSSEKLNFGLNVYARTSTNVGINTQESSGGSGSAGVVSSAFRFNPDLGIYASDGSYNISAVGDDIDNPFALTREYEREAVTERYQLNTFGQYEIFPWLTFKSTLGITVNHARDGEFFPTTLLRGAGRNGVANIDTDRRSNLLSENYLTYQNEVGSGRLSVVVGYSFQQNIRESLDAGASGFITNASSFRNLEQGAIPDIPASNLSETYLKSYYTRANYSILDKYIFTFTARYDGASNFAAQKKWAFFPSGAIGWDMKGEDFLSDVKLISQWKWRASYGLVGNQAIGAFQSLAKFQSIYATRGGALLNGIRLDDLANDVLTWETTAQLDLGLDVGLFDGRVNLSGDYYVKITDDLLFRRPLPTYVGVTSQFQNIGKLENKGIELTLNTKNSVRNLKWDTDVVFSRNRTEILELPDNGADIFYGSAPGHFLLGNFNSGETQVLREGEAIGVFYGFTYDGIYQNGDVFLDGSGFEKEAGGERFKDINGDGVLNNDDRSIIGDPNPDFTWSINNTFQYKAFDLSILLQGSQGGEMLSYTLMELDILSGANNATTDALNRWRPTTPNTDIPKASSGRSKRVSTRWLYDASYIRLKNIMIGYNLPKSMTGKLKLRSLKVYASAQNLITWTDFPGLDPEVSYRNSGNNANGNLMRGLDYGSYPNVRNYTLGVRIGF